MLGLIVNRFRSISLPIAKRLEENVITTVKSGSANTYDIVRELSKSNSKSFKTKEMLRPIDFCGTRYIQLGDRWWRKHLNLVFDLLEERNAIP
ncbi:MAG: hypothetical protein LBI29_04035 [Rickettsiales bacterium]|jgi:hypothetical protein|nr:hypothetical protein [Rickettsiales bacterium]